MVKIHEIVVREADNILQWDVNERKKAQLQMKQFHWNEIMKGGENNRFKY